MEAFHDEYVVHENVDHCEFYTMEYKLLIK